MATAGDLRFDVPLYTVEEAASFLGVPRSTFTTWAYGYVRRPGGQREVRGAPLITAIPAAPRLPRIPFVGLAEGMVAAAFRKAGVPMQHIRRSLQILSSNSASTMPWRRAGCTPTGRRFCTTTPRSMEMTRFSRWC